MLHVWATLPVKVAVDTNDPKVARARAKHMLQGHFFDNNEPEDIEDCPLRDSNDVVTILSCENPEQSDDFEEDNFFPPAG